MKPLLKTLRLGSVIMALSILAGGLCPAQAAHVDCAAPYEGDYLLAYTPASSGDSKSTGTLSSLDGEEVASTLGEDESIDGYAVSGVEEIDGKLRYQVEPEFQDIDPSKVNFAASDSKNYSLDSTTWTVGDTESFTCKDALDDDNYFVNATLMAQGARCDVFVEESYVTGGGITTPMAEALAAEFDEKQDLMQQYFGSYYVNNDGRIVLLLHDIKEYSSGDSGSIYVAGYFTSADLVSLDSGGTGNGLMMIHLDIPMLMNTGSGYDVEEGYSTTVHEFQHLINFSDSVMSGASKLNDKWWNEMMSMAAEHMFYGSLPSRISSYNDSDVVQNGGVLTYTSYSQNGSTELGANYGLPYLFGQYLRVQTEGLSGDGGAAGGDGIFKAILNSDYTDYRAVLEGLQAVGYDADNFDALQADFRIATLLNEEYGRHGFRGDADFAAVHAPLYSASGTSLAPGAMILLPLGGSFTPSAGAETGFLAFSPDAEGITVSDEYGDALTELTGGQILDITGYRSDIDDDAIPILVAAVYSPEGKMLDLWGFTGSAGIGGVSASLALPENAAGGRLKVFYVGGAGAPLCANYEMG